MKSVICLSISILFFLMLPLSAYATVDTKQFENVEGITYEYDDLDGSFYVSTDVTSIVTSLFTKSAALDASIQGGLNSSYIMTLKFYVAGYNGNFHPQSAVVKTDKNRYFFDITFGYSDDSTSLHVEFSVLSCGVTALKMIDDILSSKDVQIRINGGLSSVDFSPDKWQLDNLKLIHNAYNKAGGIEANTDSIDDIDEKYDFSVIPIE